MNTDSITRTAAGMAHTAIDRAEQSVQPLEDQIRDASATAGEHAAELPTMEAIEQFIQEKPLQAASIAFVAGVFTTLLLRR